MSRLPSPCRLSVFLASQVPVGVVLRRGPNPWTGLVLWDRRTDAFTPGQWFHGRVYGRRCDLSPDGRLFVYFAAKFGRRPDPYGIGEAWTAVSRPPYFTALALWRNLGAWYGGGAFSGPRSLLLDATCTMEAHPEFPPKRLKLAPCPRDSAPWEQRLLRDGWTLVERGFDPRTHRRMGRREMWRKPHPDGRVSLWREVEDVDFRRYGGIYADSYWLETADDLIPLPGATWADWDGRRLVFARAGRLLAATPRPDRLDETELYDFNPLRPRTFPSPDWARQWYWARQW